MIIGVVGKANVGKSTFFKSLTLANILIANYPFATIDPNRGFGMVRVPCVDKELGVKCMPRTGFCKNNVRFVPVEVIDVAGLVPGAHEGKGMGNKFLDDLRQANALIHVIDASGSTNEKGEPVQPGSYDPLYDVKFLDFELDMWYLSILKKGWDKFSRQTQHEQRSMVDALAEQLSGLNATYAIVEKAVKALQLDPKKPLEWSEESLHKLAVELRKKTKPMLIVANKMDMPSAKKNIERLRKEFPDRIIIPCSAESELALKEASRKGLVDYLPGSGSFEVRGELDEKQSKALDFIHKLLDEWGSTGVQDALDAAVFKLLEYIAVFPGGVGKLGDSQGNILPDCFLLPPGSTAIDFAEHIHTDLAKNFVAAIDVRSRKKIGRDHELQHRDIVEIKTA